MRLLLLPVREGLAQSADPSLCVSNVSAFDVAVSKEEAKDVEEVEEPRGPPARELPPGEAYAIPGSPPLCCGTDMTWAGVEPSRETNVTAPSATTK